MSSSSTFEEMEKGFDLAQAIAEANRCLLCHDAPCSKGCPADTDPGTFIRKLRFKNIRGAIRTIKENNILGGLCGVLCPTADLCEKECCATGIDRPIEIGKIQRALIEHSWTLDFEVFDKPVPRDSKIAVVGSGPAGLACAAELAKDGYQVTVFEARPKPGGVLSYGVPSYRFDDTFLEKELKAVTDLGVEIKCNSPIKGKDAAEALLKEGYSALFLAPGLWAPLRLSDDTPDMDGLLNATDYLPALRDGRLNEMKTAIDGKTVAVIGGGSVAMDCAESALKLGARDVYVVYRRSYTQMPAEKEEKDEALNIGIHFLVLNQPVGYEDDSGKLKSIRLIRTRLGEKDASGRRRPEEIPGTEWNLDVDVVIEAIGSKPEAGSPEWYPSVTVSSKGLILADNETGETSVKNIYAGGDIVRGAALIVQAVSDGKKAAASIKQQLSEKEDA